MIGDLGDDTVLGGAGDADEVAGSLGIDTRQRRPRQTSTSSTATTATTAWTAAPAAATSPPSRPTSAPASGGGVWVSLAKHKARGDGHDRLFRFESLEGSAFDDILIGSKQRQRDRRRPRQRHDPRRRRRATRSTAARARTAARAPRAGPTSCGKEAPPKASAYVELDPTPGGGGGLAIVGGGGPDEFTVAFDAGSEAFGITAAKGIAIGPGCSRARQQPDPGQLRRSTAPPAG